MARSYHDQCGIARALDVVGERWSLLVIRELMFGPKRFGDLQNGLPHIGPDMLAQRLRDLDAAGVLIRTTLPPPAGSRVYQLTDRGRELQPVLEALGRFGSREPISPDLDTFGPDAAALALPTTFSPARAGSLAADIRLDLDEHVFLVHVADGVLTVERPTEPDPAADVQLRTDPRTLAALLWHGGSLPDAIEAGTVELAGSRRTATRFLKAFSLAP